MTHQKRLVRGIKFGLPVSLTLWLIIFWMIGLALGQDDLQLWTEAPHAPDEFNQSFELDYYTVHDFPIVSEVFPVTDRMRSAILAGYIDAIDCIESEGLSDQAHDVHPANFLFSIHQGQRVNMPPYGVACRFAPFPNTNFQACQGAFSAPRILDLAYCGDDGFVRRITKHEAQHAIAFYLGLNVWTVIGHSEGPC